MNSFTDTLGQAIEAIRQELNTLGVVVADETWLDAFSSGGMPYETRKEAHGEIATLKGKKTKKFVHATVYRFNSGRYEWLVYCL